MLKVLFTGGGGAGVEALARLLDTRYEMHFADADVSAIAPAVRAERRHAIPMAGAQWASAVADLCRLRSIDVLVPCVDEELPLIGELAGQCPSLRCLVPDAGFVTLMKDKLTSMQALRAAQLDAPRTELVARAAEIGFPCLVKPRDGRGSRGVQILNGPAEVEAYQVLTRRPPDMLVAQELLRGREWTVYVSTDGAGRLRCIVPVRVDAKRGITIRAETVRHAAIIDYCRQIHERFPTKGAFNVQLMETPEGRLAAFEINPRVSTTLALAIAAGADPIADMLSVKPVAALCGFTEGLKLSRYWLNDIAQVRSE